MDRNAFIDEIRFRLTGSVLETEIDEAGFNSILNMTLREVQRYIRDTKVITIPYSKCIDTSTLKDEDNNPIKIAGVDRVYRTSGSASSVDYTTSDPVALQYYTLYGLGSMRSFQSQLYNYMSWNTMSQIQNTLSTDLIFKYDRYGEKLYISVNSGTPAEITIEYIPRFDDVSEIKSDYWIDIIMRMAVANAKIVVGRIRSRYTQSNALWQQDGEQILNEGTNELEAIRQHLKDNTQLCYPID